MEKTIVIGSSSIRVERAPISGQVTLTLGTWPTWSSAVITQSEARQIGEALIAAGFDYAHDPEATPPGMEA
jgi:hypothetical protein